MIVPSYVPYAARGLYASTIGKSTRLSTLERGLFVGATCPEELSGVVDVASVVLRRLNVTFALKLAECVFNPCLMRRI